MPRAFTAHLPQLIGQASWVHGWIIEMACHGMLLNRALGHTQRGQERCAGRKRVCAARIEGAAGRDVAQIRRRPWYPGQGPTWSMQRGKRLQQAERVGMACARV